MFCDSGLLWLTTLIIVLALGSWSPCGFLQRCDGGKPICGRCSRLHKDCVFTNGIHRRKRTEILEDRIDALQKKILEMGRGHDRALVSNQLFQKMALLKVSKLAPEAINAPRKISDWVPLFPLTEQPYPYVDSLARGAVLLEEPEEGYRPVILRSKIEAMFAEWDSTKEVTPDMMVHL